MTETRWLDADEERSWRALRRLLTALPARLGRDLTALGLSSTDYEVLSTLSERDGWRWGLKDLAKKMEWSRSRLSHHAARMEARGLIEREPDPDDGRGSIYHLTDTGFQTLAAAAPGHLDSVRRRLLDHLSRDELAVLERISTRIADLPD
ncbi:MarR family transcriptional regulator [Actinocatenispora sera]|uniref:MarR family transcriptional regulator n=1 Tax=Actinocatenispora sera TaxID=390989 RepID=A0A810KW73_9ACTN|nr:MarR family transcriptional regulator [Actinocatenispora sera]BCJ26712.1 MarR family transcriptional regulator [Actinocatenispora sera]